MASINYFLVWKKRAPNPLLVLQKPLTIDHRILDQILQKSLTELDSSRILHLDSSFLIFIQIKFEVLYFCITDISYPINLASQFISRIESRLFDIYSSSLIYDSSLKIESNHKLQFENLFQVYNSYQDPETFRVLSSYKSNSQATQFPSPTDYKSFILPITPSSDPIPPPSEDSSKPSPSLSISIKLSIFLIFSSIILLTLYLNYWDIT